MSKLDQFNPEIAEKIRGGSYYKEAWDWYALKYIYPVTQRTLFLFLTIAAVMVMCATAVIVYDFYPLKTYAPVVVEIEDMSKDYSQLRRLPLQMETNPTTPVAEYFARKYVERIESYDFKRIDPQLKFLEQFSTAPLFREIRKRYDTYNLDSLILKYRDHTSRSVKIKNWRLELPEGFSLEKPNEQLVGLRDIPFRAYVDFESQESNVLGITQRQWQATIDFTLSPVMFDKAKQAFNPLDFRVSNYSVRPL